MPLYIVDKSPNVSLVNLILFLFVEKKRFSLVMDTLTVHSFDPVHPCQHYNPPYKQGTNWTRKHHSQPSI